MAAQRKYPEELRERVVKMLSEVREREAAAGAISMEVGVPLTPPGQCSVRLHTGT
jgi:hypothetical protein